MPGAAGGRNRFKKAQKVISNFTESFLKQGGKKGLFLQKKKKNIYMYCSK